MTQNRKDELYDQMFSWICEHIPSDKDLFLPYPDWSAGNDEGRTP